MSDEADRRIEEAAEIAKREKERKEFLEGLTRNDEVLKPIRNPEAWILRDKLKAAAKRGELKRTPCTHPLALIQQYVDDDPSVGRYNNPVNLFECTVCHLLLHLADPWGDDIDDS